MATVSTGKTTEVRSPFYCNSSDFNVDDLF
jgi:hypothetical protein